MTDRYSSGTWLSRAIGYEAKGYLPDETRKLILDWCMLDALIKSVRHESKFFDWSFLIAPMYKAVEGTLWKVAEDLNIVKGDGILGNFFDEVNIEKNLKLIEQKSHGSTKHSEIKRELSELKTFLKRYRHNPSHYGKFFPTYEQAEIAAKGALHNIGCLVNDLISQGLIKSTGGEIPTIAYGDDVPNEDIPF